MSWSKGILDLKDIIRFKIAKFKYDYQASTVPFNIQNIKNVLINRCDAKIGDTIYFLTFFRELKKCNPNIKIFVLGPTHIFGELEKLSIIDQVISMSKRPKKNEIQKCISSLPAIDLLIALNYPLRPRELFLLNKIKAPYCVTLQPNELKCSNIDIVHSNSQETVYKNHFLTSILRILSIGKASNIDSSLVKLYENDVKNIKRSRLEIDNYADTKIIGLNPYGNSGDRKLNTNDLLLICNEILTQSPYIVEFFVGPKDRAEILNFIQQNYQNENRIKIAPITENFSQIIAIPSSYDAFIGVDTATVHIVSCYDIPQIAIYGPDMDNFYKWEPRSNNAICMHLESSSLSNLPIDNTKKMVKTLLSKLK